jgi:hypothetical protein
VTYRDVAPGTRRVVVDLVDPLMRTRAMKMSAGTVIAASFGATTGMLAAPVAGAAIGAVLTATAIATWRLERRLAARTRVTIDERSQDVRIERFVPRAPTETIAVLPLDAALRFVSTGTIEDGRRLEVVALHLRDEKIAEVVRKPDGMIASFAFAYVDDVVRRLNAALAEMTRASEEDRP